MYATVPFRGQKIRFKTKEGYHAFVDLFEPVKIARNQDYWLKWWGCELEVLPSLE